MEYYNPKKDRPVWKPRRQSAYLQQALDSNLVSKVLAYEIVQANHSPPSSSKARIQVLEEAKQDFQHKQLPNNHANKSLEQSPKVMSQLSPLVMKRPTIPQQPRQELRNPLIYEYEMKRAAYNSGQTTPRSFNPQINRLPYANYYNFNNDSAIFKKQSHDFNIISTLPEAPHPLRQYHKLSTQNKLFWNPNQQLMVPTLSAPHISNPEKIL